MVRSWMQAVVVCSGLLAVGCAPYVNIPPQAGDVALHNSNLRTVQNITVEAVSAVTERRPVGTYTLVLPPGTMPDTYAAVIERLGDEATTEVLADRPILEVRQLRIRADRAEADVVRPSDAGSPRGPGQLVTVFLRWEPFLGWTTHRIHAYTTLTQVTVPEPDYAIAPPSVEEAVHEQPLDESVYEETSAADLE